MSSQIASRTILGFGKSLLLSALGISLVAINLNPTNAFAAGRSRADRSAEIVVDADTGNIIYEDNATARRYPASITKVMTLYLLFDAIESGRVSLDDEIVFSRNADRQPPTALGVSAGESITVETAILSLALRSANDSATAVAEFLGGTEAQFARMMTAKAHELGMISTNFVNASGLPNSNQYSTAEDLAKLAIAIRRDFPRQFHWFSRQSFVFNGQVITNHNHLVGQVEGVDGLKTGYIGASGFNLAATATRGGHRIVTVVMGGPNRHVRDERVISLVDNAFASLGVVRMGASSVVDFTQNSSDERDQADSFALATNEEEYSRTNMRSANATPTSNVQRSVGGFTWRTPSTNTSTVSTVAAQVKSASSNFQVAVINDAPVRTAPVISNKPEAIADAVKAGAKPEPVPQRVELAQVVAAPAVVETQVHAQPPANEPMQFAQILSRNETIETISVNQADNRPEANTIVASNEVLPQFTVPSQTVAQTQTSEPTQFTADTQISENNTSDLKLVSNDSMEFVQNLREEAAQREKERLEAIETAENKAEVERQAQIRQRQIETRRQAEIQRRADERRERQRIQLAETEAREARAKAEKQERDRQMALANQRGNVTIQIGAFKERKDAQDALASMTRHLPSFASKQVTTFNQSGSTWFRARVSGLGINAAETACRAILRSGGRCSIVSR